ncbi:MAG: hypothetical protein HN396_10850 [Gemmatimonadales bacterium]|jgi:hypothetical protein|nr:hypothetical protein [Gemmatimonadales bacterium]
MPKSYPLQKEAAESIKVIMGLRDLAIQQAERTPEAERVGWLNQQILDAARTAGKADEAVPDVPMMFHEATMSFIDRAAPDEEDDDGGEAESDNV